MKNSVKVCIGLSMPALALAALWFWSLSRKRKQGQVNHTEIKLPDDDANNANEEAIEEIEISHAPELPAESEPAGVDQGQKRARTLEKTESMSTSSVGSRKESLSDKSSNTSTSESASDEQKSGADISVSDLEMFRPGTDDLDQEEETWEVEFPQALCGRLIGKKGKNVQKISQVTGTRIRLIPQKENSESSQRLVSLTGSPKQLTLALNALQEKFPSVPFKRLNGTNTAVLTGGPVIDTVHMVLPEHGMFQVVVTSIVDANHFYVQLVDQMQTGQMMLQQLDQQMYQCYGNQGAQTTIFPHAVATGMVCASYSPCGWWRRAQVVGLLMKPDEVEITWLDYGGKETVPISMLKHIRQEFLQLPFQAVECYLSNVVPHQGESSFSMTACALFEGLTQNCVVTARITSYNRECPCLELYVPQCQWTGQSTENWCVEGMLDGQKREPLGLIENKSWFTNWSYFSNDSRISTNLPFVFK